jgi:hypothetical protein
MNEYLMYQLWQQREERMPHELEQQRVVEERMLEQELERELAVSAEQAVEEAPATAERPNADDYVLVDE